jgi:hypothetical protein
MMRCSWREVGRGLVVATLLAVGARAQFVGGTVVDKKSEKPIRGVRVALVDSNAKKIFAETVADTTTTFSISRV